MPTNNDRKGKGISTSTTRTAPDERSPLLGQSSAASATVRHGRGLLDDEDGDDDDNHIDNDRLAPSDTSSNSNVDGVHRRRRQRREKIQTVVCYAGCGIIALVFIAFAVIHIWLGRFVSEQYARDGAAMQARAREAVVYRGPDRVELGGVSRDGALLSVDMRMGIHVPTVFGWNGTATRRVSFTRRIERRLVAWAARRTGQVSVDLPEPVLLSPSSSPSDTMAQFILSGPIILPLYFPKSLRDIVNEDDSWLKPVKLSIPLKVLDADTLATFINDTMKYKGNSVSVHIQQADVGLGRDDDRSWFARTMRQYGAKSVRDIFANSTFAVPESPDIPSDPAELVQLLNYTLVPIPQAPSSPDNSPAPVETLAVYADARVSNPGYEQLEKYGLDLEIPFAWPYRIQLPVSHRKRKKGDKHNDTSTPDRALLARGVVEPFKIPSTHKHFNVSINATVERTDNASTPLSRSLSLFVTRFLSGENNTALVSFDQDSPFADSLPSFLIPFLKEVEVAYALPGLPPDERDLLKDLQIKDMKVHGSEDGSGGLQIDGLMEGRIVFPEGMDALDDAINITAVWPDILLYDNLAPPADGDDGNGKIPPVPLPLNAFARFRTNDYTPAETVKLEDGTTIMRAHVKNVPFEILRADVLRRWIAKIVFSGGKGVRTGIKGVSQAQATLRGFGDVELHKLPVLGVFYAQNPYGH